MLGFDRLELLNEPYFAYAYWTKIDLGRKTAFYKALLGRRVRQNQDSLFLLPPQRVEALARKLEAFDLLHWEEPPRVPSGYVVICDGYGWELKLYQGERLVWSMKELNSKPDWFDPLIFALEEALGRTLGSKLGVYGEFPEMLGQTAMRRIRSSYGGSLREHPPASLPEVMGACFPPVDGAPPEHLFPSEQFGRQLLLRGVAELAGLLLLSDGLAETMPDPRTGEPLLISWIVYPLREILESTAFYAKTYGLRGIVFSDNGAGDPYLLKPDGRVALFDTADQTEEIQADSLIKFFEPK